jgi:hypothetical protein
VTDKEEVSSCIDPLDDSHTKIIEHRPLITTEKLFWAFLISTCLLIVNFIGLESLLGTGPSDALAPLFVIGVGAFYVQFQILGLFAALLPGALHWRMLLPIGLTLALCAEVFYFYRRVGTEGIPYVLLVGFFSSLVFFSLIRAFFSLEMNDLNQDSKAALQSHMRFGIRDLFVLTIVVALCLFMQRVESSYRMSMGMKSQDAHLVLTIAVPLLFLATAILFAPPHFVLGINRSPKRIVVSLFWIAFAVLGVPLLIIGVVIATRTIVNFQNWPYLFCLTLGAEATWLVGLGCMKLLGLRFQITSPRSRDKDFSEVSSKSMVSSNPAADYC